jgi:hypothetical protein
MTHAHGQEKNGRSTWARRLKMILYGTHEQAVMKDKCFGTQETNASSNVSQVHVSGLVVHGAWCMHAAGVEEPGIEGMPGYGCVHEPQVVMMRKVGWDKASQPGSVTQETTKQRRVGGAGFSEGKEATWDLVQACNVAIRQELIKLGAKAKQPGEMTDGSSWRMRLISCIC